LESVILSIILIGSIRYFIIHVGTVPHIPILLGIFFLIFYGLVIIISFRALQAGMVDAAKAVMGVGFLSFLICILISSWMVSRTMPVLINTGFTWVGGQWLYALVFAVTAIIGVSLGSSLTTTATIGVAFIGIAEAMDASLAITAGAIV